MSKRTAIVISAAVFATVGLLLPALDLVGKHNRAASSHGRDSRVVFVRDAGQLWETWEGRKLRGRIIIHFGRHLHYVAVPENKLYSLSRGPIAELDLFDAYRRNLSDRNYLWVGARTGFFRAVQYVLSESDLMRRRTEAGIPNGESFSVYDWGFPRTFSLRPPQDLTEPPVVHVDLSWLDEHSPEEVVELLKSLKPKPDVVTVSAAEDGQDKQAVASKRLARLKELLPNGAI